MIWCSKVLWHFNHCRLLNAKSSLYLYIKYIWFSLIWFYGISTIVGRYQILFLHMYWIYMIWFGWVLWHINHCRLFKAKSFLYILLYFDPRPSPKMLFQGDTPEGSDTFQWPVIERDRVGGFRLMIWDKVKVPLCHYSDAPEESNLWTAW